MQVNYYDSVEKIAKSRQPRVIFQFPFFFGREDNKVSKDEYSSIYNRYITFLSYFDDDRKYPNFIRNVVDKDP